MSIRLPRAIRSALRGRALPVTCSVALLLACATARAATGTPVETAGEVQPIVSLRDSGYLLGDLIDERIDLVLPPGFVLDPDSLPLPGRVAPWMEMRRTRIEPGHQAGQIGIVATYQIFAEVEQAERVPIPAFKLRLRGDGATRTVEIPQKSFLLSPALPASLTDEDRELKPTPAPQPLPIAATVYGLAVALLVASSCAGWLLWLHDRLPFLPRSPGPFARTWRRWRRRGRRELNAAECAALLRDWHHAVNLAAGETLYTATLPRLFARAPYLEALRHPFEDLFARSRQFFYAPPQSALPPAQDVLRLLRAAAEHERGLPC